MTTTIENAAVGSRAERPTSYDPADHPVPTGREEEWRFTPVDRIQEFFADPVTSTPTGSLSWDTTLPEGVTTGVVPAEQVRDLSGIAPEDRPAALAATPAEGAVLVEVPANAELDEPVVLRLAGAEGPGASDAAAVDTTASHGAVTGPIVHGHLAIRVGANARATIVVRHTGRARYSERVSVMAGEGSHVTVVSLQEWAPGAQHLGEHAIEVAKDATVRHIVVTLGGDLVRLCTAAKFQGTGGDLELLGLYYTDSDQHQEHRLFVDHSVPNCKSRATYKGALQGDGAHAVWVGDVLIGKDAEGTDTYELNRNLVLTEGAHADSVPNLEIETGEIEGAGHASATGRFDDEQLFYLQSRGGPEAQARRLVVRGVFGELIHPIGVPSIQDKLMEAIEVELSRTLGAE